MTSIAAVMTAITEVAVAGEIVERAYDWPTLQVNPPALVVGYPDLNFDFTFRGGTDRATYPVWIICGLADQRSSRDVLSKYVTGGGATVKAVLDGDLAGAVRSCRVVNCNLEVVNIGGLDYAAARFDLDVLSEGESTDE